MSALLPSRDRLRVPDRLVLTTPTSFRAVAQEYVSRCAREGAKEVDVDLSETVEIDATGLGTLALIQQWARRHEIPVRLHGVRQEVRELLDLTRLTGRFRLD